MNQRIVLITGASSGIGYDAAVLLAKQGHKVYGAARRVELMQPLRELGVVPVRLDITDEACMLACYVNETFSSQNSLLLQILVRKLANVKYFL